MSSAGPIGLKNPLKARTWKGVAGGVYTLIDTIPLWKFLFEQLMRRNQVACDTEANSLKFVTGHIVGMSFSWGAEHSYYVPVRHETGEKQLKMEDILPDLLTFFGREDLVTIWWNAKFDLHFYMNEGIIPKGIVHDGLIQHKLLKETGSAGLKDLAKKEIDPMADMWKTAVDDFRSRKGREKVPAPTPSNPKRKVSIKKANVHYGMVPLNLMTPYSASDTHYTWALWKKKMMLIAENSELRQLYLMESQLLWVLLDMEHRGTLIGRKYLVKAGPELEAEAKSYEASAIEKLGQTINLASNDELAKALKKIKIPLNKKTEKGHISLDVEVMERLATRYEVCQNILDFRQTKKLKSTYVDNILSKIDANDYLHTSYNQNVVTGRMASSDPNCFDEETEVLTSSGFVPFPEAIPLWKELKFAQYDQETQEIDFTRAESCTQRPAKPGEMVRIKQQQVSLLVTRKHEIILKKRRSDVVERVFAEDIREDRKWIHCGYGQFKGTWDPGKVFIQLLCAVQADGHVIKRKSWYSCDFGFKKIRKYERLVRLLSIAGESFTKINDKKRLRLVWSNSERLDEIIRFLGEGKTYGPWLLNLPYNLVDVLLEELRYWDGLSTRKSNQYLSKDEQNVDWIQILYVLRNRRARKRYYTNNHDRTYSVIDIPEKRSDSYTTNIHLTDSSYDKDVYCVSVPKGNIVVRREGKVVITGNCQNIPAKTKVIRRAFVCPDGHLMVFIDYSQIEVRLTAHYSKDPVLLDAYNVTHRDVHTNTMCEVFGHNYDEAIKILDDSSHPMYDELSLLRKVAKTTNFLVIYGGGADNLRAKISSPKRQFSKDKCQTFIDKYFNKLRKLKKWINRVSAQVLVDKYVQNYFGRYRRFPELEDLQKLQPWERGRCQRQAVNFLIQGTAADLFKVAMVRVGEILKGMKSRLVMVIHDEIVFYIHKSEIDVLSSIVKTMEDWHFDVPIIAEVSYATNSWAGKKPLHV